jgi:deoxycytidylate deaminase
MALAEIMSERSRCTRGGVGAVIVSPTNRIVATGYTGPAAGYMDKHPTCQAVCPRALKDEPPSHYHDCISIHAEANALIFCDRRDREGGTMYTTSQVCWDCAKMIANSGLHKLVYREVANVEHREPESSIEYIRWSGLRVVRYA